MSFPSYPPWAERTAATKALLDDLAAVSPRRAQAGAPQSARADAQGIYATGVVSGGSYKITNVPLTAGGVGTTASIAWNANGPTIAAAVNAAGGSVLVPTNTATTPTQTTPVVLTATGALANQSLALMVIDNTNGGSGGITGGGAVAVQRLATGTAGSFVGALTGELAQDSATGDTYRNTGTATVPAWTPTITIARPPQRTGDIYGFFGDSIATYNEAMVSEFHGGWPGYGMVASRGRIQALRNFGIGGDTTTQMLARIGVVLASPISKCVVLGGINDFQALASVASVFANLKTIWTTLAGAGIEPILCTLTPYGVASGSLVTIQQRIGALNFLIQDYACTNGLMCVDFHTRLVDPATGGWLSTYSSDSIHPTSATARRIMGQTLADTVMGTVPRAYPWCASNVNDYATGGAAALVPGGLFLTNTGGIGTGFAVLSGTGTATTPAPSGTENTAIGGAGILGNWQQWVWGSGSPAVLYEFLTGGLYAVGDILQISGYVTTANVEASAGKAQVIVQFNGGLPHIFAVTFDMDATTGRFVARGTVPTGTTTCFVYLSSQTGTTTLKVAQLTVVNRTTQGLTN